MSSPQNPTATTTAILAVAAPTPPSDPPAPRKFPAPCWTQEETLALISSYQDKWYSLRRRNLRTADWEAVAEEVTRRCPNHFPAKTSAQCRHKMEKLRKRYRTEKQRINSVPSNGRYFGSSWVFFDLIDSMELGTSSAAAVSNATHHLANPNPNNYMHVSNINISKVDLDVKPFMIGKSNNVSNVNVSEVNGSGGGGDGKKGDLGKYFDEIMLGIGGGSGGGGKGKSQNHEFDVRSAAPHIKFKVKHHHQQHFNHGRGVVGGDVNDDFDESDEYVGDGGRSLMAPPGGFKRKSEPSYDDCDEIFLMRKDSRDGSRPGKESVVGEMVTAIKMLGEGLVKMEKMKIDMMRDIEKMRMEMELKRSEMILESQHLIVNAFVEGLKKHKKVKVVDNE